jgi:hypothetical protein
MSPIALMLNLLLAGLLVMALAVGFRLERRLKALRDSHAGFTDAVAELDQAARRAELGLAALRTATDEALELLVGRIDKARELAAKLEQLTIQGAVGAERKGPRQAEDRREARPQARTPPPMEAPAALRAPTAGRDLEAESAAAAMVEHLVLKLSRDDAVSAKPAPRIDGRVEGRLDARLAARAEPRKALRARTSIDDDLFVAPPPGGRAPYGGRS